MSHRLALKPTTLLAWLPHQLCVALASMLLLAAAVCTCHADEPDLEAFRAAKQTYFRNPSQAAQLFRKFMKEYRDSKWRPE
ncbi:unnamed protein product, partial [marine sediment metagenome]